MHKFESLPKINPDKPQDNITYIEAVSQKSSSFDKTFEDGSPFFTWIEFNITDLCNRTCSFCPRVDPKVYPNNDKEISLELYEKIMKDLADIGWEGGIVYSAFSEPLLCRKLRELLQITKEFLPGSFVEIVTNGDLLTADLAKDLLWCGMDVIKVSLYDGAFQIDPFKRMRKKSGLTEDQFILRYRWDPEGDYGLILSNRAGTIDFNQPTKLPLKNNCHFTFYKLMIDYDGRVLLCSHDWIKKRDVGNLNRQTVAEVWTSKKMKFVRDRLGNKKRNFNPCIKCDVNGTLGGMEEFKRWAK